MCRRRQEKFLKTTGPKGGASRCCLLFLQHRKFVGNMAQLPRVVGAYMRLVSLQYRILAAVLCLAIASPPTFAYRAAGPAGFNKEEGLQAADILGVRSHVDRLLAMRTQGQLSDDELEQLLLLKSIIVRKILRGVLEVRQACNKVDLELAYAYDILAKEQRRQALITSLFNLAVFSELSTFYTLEPFMRIHKYFVTSAVFTTVSGSLGTTIATISRIHGKYAKASHIQPPKILNNIIDGRPVDTSGMPPLVTKFLDYPEPGQQQSRRDELFATWKKQYHIDTANRDKLFGIADKKRASIGYLNSRILLLWSLHTFVQDLDRNLLSLLKLVRNPAVDNPDMLMNSYKRGVQYSSGSAEVAALLNLNSQLEELKVLRRDNINNVRRDELELQILESSLEAAMEVQVAADRVDEELNYNYHIVLAQLLQSRGKALQMIYDANFIQSGILGIIAGKSYLSKNSITGDTMFVISGGIGTGLTTLATLTNHGFWRKVDTGPTGLAQVMDLHPAEPYRFSPFISCFLNDIPPGITDGMTRAEYLNKKWAEHKVSAVNINKQKNREKLANMPHKYDTIKIVSNRIKLLHSLKKELEAFHIEVLELLRTTDTTG